MADVLQGIRIIDWTIFQQGPYAGVLLGALGAEVIKVEQVPSESKAKSDAMDADMATIFGYLVSEEKRNTPEGSRRCF